MVCARRPEGFIVKGQEQKALPLNKALYGLQQAPRAWNTKLDQTLRALYFTNNDAKHAVYARGHDS